MGLMENSIIHSYLHKSNFAHAVQALYPFLADTNEASLGIITLVYSERREEEQYW